MGYKPVPFAQPLYCSAKPGHILLEWYDGSIIDCKSSITRDIPRQLNGFTSNFAMWALRFEGTFYVGNSLGTYLQIRESDGVLVSCGSWDSTQAPTFEECGLDGHVACVLCRNDRRTIISPARNEVFRVREPIMTTFAEQSQIMGEFSDTTLPVVLTERGLVDFETDGTWIPTPERDWTLDDIPMGLR